MDVYSERQKFGQNVMRTDPDQVFKKICVKTAEGHDFAEVYSSSKLFEITNNGKR